MKTIPTYTATIYVGCRPGYSRDHTVEDDHRIADTMVVDMCRAYCERVKLCLTVERTTFVYVGGMEGGARVGLINYPRFPRTVHEVRFLALDLAHKLMTELGQERVSVVFPDETVMLEKDDPPSELMD